MPKKLIKKIIKKEIKKETHDCEFCKRKFSNELSLINHGCEKKRRWFNKEEPTSRLAFMAWLRFYELNIVLYKDDQKKQFREFIDSKFYSAFIKFAKNMIAINASEPAKFIDYVIKNNLPVDKWSNDIVYEQYINDLVTHESPEAALSRTLELIRTWSQQNNEPWFDFFRKVSPSQMVSWIKNGRISPWVLYNSDSAELFFNRCGEEHLQMITSFAKIHQWKIRFIRDKECADWIRNTLREAGL